MRIIGGKYKRRQIQAPKNLPVRPTTDMAKEALFNMISNRYVFSQISALDLFAGTGNISYELASRGCRQIVAVEKNKQCCQFIRKTINLLDFSQIQVEHQDAFQYLYYANTPFDIIFADPPYDLKYITEIPALVFKKQLLKKDGILIVEHGEETNLTQQNHYLYTKKYSRVNFSFFSYEK